ncbi:MAG: ABC transporter permease subunit [Trueperaceae bacterium]
MKAATTFKSVTDIPQTAIKLEHVSVEFDGKAVLRDVNLEVNQGEFIALIGPSGGGKSTLLRVIAGLLEATGTVNVNCKPAVVFQDYRLLPWRTVHDNVALPRELTGQGEDADDVLKQVGMLEHADRYPHQLSGGMRARVAIARALAQDAEVLLMDEPFAALDALVRERFNLEMKRLHEKTLHEKNKKTIVFVTHSIREAVYLADRVVVLQDGRIDTILDSRNEGRITAYDDGIEAVLRAKLGMADSTFVETTRKKFQFPWEILGVIGLTALVFLLWTLATTRVSSQTAFLFPSPRQVWEAAINSSSYLIPHTLATLRVMALGVLTSLLIGIPLGYAMGRKQTLERLFSPFIVALQAIPTIVIAPLLVIWLGYGLSSKLVTTTLISIFPVLISTMVGVREVDRTYREVFKTIGATPWGIFSKLELPGALPVVLGGLRLTVTLALIGTVVSEFVFGGPGLGYFSNTERLNFRVANALAAVGINVTLGLGLYLIVSLLEQWVLRYRKV